LIVVGPSVWKSLTGASIELHRVNMLLNKNLHGQDLGGKVWLRICFGFVHRRIVLMLMKDRCIFTSGVDFHIWRPIRK
jgi:hypothetical protein